MYGCFNGLLILIIYKSPLKAGHLSGSILNELLLMAPYLSQTRLE
jgi:hypothetical protein